VGSSFSHIRYILVKFIYESHRVKVKVTGALRDKMVKNPYFRNAKPKLPSAIKLRLYKTWTQTADRILKFVRRLRTSVGKDRDSGSVEQGRQCAAGRGSRTDSCGTPHTISVGDDAEETVRFQHTIQVPARYDWNHWSTIPDRPYEVRSRRIRMSWSTVSKAADRSSKHQCGLWNSLPAELQQPDITFGQFKRLCLVSWAATPCVWTLRAPTRNLLITYLLTYLHHYMNFCSV